MPYYQPNAGASYVGGGATTTVAQLLATYPAAAQYLGLYARVSDLWGGTDEIMRCSSDGSSYFWRPQRTDYAVNNAATSGNVSLTPLVSAPIQVLTGTLLGNLTVPAPASQNAWPGAQFTIVAKGVLGIFGISLTGLTGGTLPLLAGGSRLMTYSGGAWTGA